MPDSAQHALFVCYSHTDEAYRHRLARFLKSEAFREVKIFQDVEIEVGEEWKQKISESLAESTAAVVLVSQDFMISPFIQQVEMKELLTRNIERGLRLFLVPVSAMQYEGTYLEKFQWARPPDKPLSLLRPEEQEVAMLEVCKQLIKQLASQRDAPAIQRTIECLNSVPMLDLPAMYELEKPVGEGEFARCYQAHDRLLDRKVIVKVLNGQLSRDSAAYDKYVRSTSKLNHRNILGVLFSQANKLPHFIVTPALAGPTLAARVAQERLPIDHVVRYAIQLADALAHAHRHQCVHGRLRPGEIRLDGEDHLMLSGFRTLEHCKSTIGSAARVKLSLEEFVYSSPEYRDQGIVDEKSDQYLLGLVVYQMMCGAPLVRASSWADILKAETASAVSDPTALKDIVPECDAQISDIVMRMLRADPSSRWDCLDTVVEKLQQALSRTSRQSLSAADAAKESYRRCAREDLFYEVLYKKLFVSVPEIRGMFASSMEPQYQVLRDALWLLLSYPDMREQHDPTILSGVARTHAHYEPQYFDIFRDAVLEAVAECDPQAATTVDAWRSAIAPGIEYMKTKAKEAAVAKAALLAKSVPDGNGGTPRQSARRRKFRDLPGTPRR